MSGFPQYIEKDPPPRLRYSACMGKKTFDSWTQAKKATSGRRALKNVKIYRCKFCHDWHIGNNRGMR